MNLVKIFVSVDDFCKVFIPKWHQRLISDGSIKRNRKSIPKLAKNMTGKLFAGKGYIFQPLFEKFLEYGLKLITGIKKNMNNTLMRLFDKIMLRKRAMIESVNNQLKNVFQLEHTRHRSPINGVANMIAALVDIHHDRKALIGITKQELIMLQNI